LTQRLVSNIIVLSTEDARGKECMNLKRTVIFIAVILIIGLSAYALSFGANIGNYEVVPVRDAIKYGLDLRGGVYVVLEARPDKGETVTGDMLDRAVATIRNRVDALGVSEPVIVKQGGKQDKGGTAGCGRQ
jgi:preprotein translocase subunit SecD